jgi:hypothetical protein
VSGAPSSEPATTAARDTPTTASTARVTRAVRSTRSTVTTAMARTAPTAAGFGKRGAAYAPNVSAIAAQLALLPTTNPHPARNPHSSPRRLRP